MSVRHIHARRDEHIVVQRDKDPGCLGIIIVIILIAIIAHGC